VGAASGTDFPDALAGGAATGARGGVMTLVSPTQGAAAAADLLIAQRDTVQHQRMYGGTGAVSDAAQSALVTLLR
jgi:hypothetical protein